MKLLISLSFMATFVGADSARAGLAALVSPPHICPGTEAAEIIRSII